MTYTDKVIEDILSGQSPRKAIAETCGIVFNNYLDVLAGNAKAVSLAKKGDEKGVYQFIKDNSDKLGINIKYSNRQARRLARELTRMYVNKG